MKQFMKLLCAGLLIFCLSSAQTQNVARDSGSESAVLPLGDSGVDAKTWFERALGEDPPWMLVVSADEETHL